MPLNPKAGDVINVPATVLHVIEDNGKKTLMLRRIEQPGRGSTAGDPGTGEGFAVLWTA